MLAAIVKIGQNHDVGISALEDGGQGHGSTSRHYTGVGVDFWTFDGQEVNGRDAASLALINSIASSLPTGSRFGQSGCPGTPATLPAGISEFPDACTHIHMDLPEGTP